MQRSSETIGAIAAALAKAQAQLVNPEKSLIGTIGSDQAGGSQRSFRYAPLSNGLDIVRKTLSQHEIATVQTTSIDDSAGIVRLSTVLAHASGEWIASDWPVCAISETAAPHRMGAALTYARRYALFTLVGIAGEDDLDVPDLIAPTTPSTRTEPDAGKTKGRPNGGQEQAAQYSSISRSAKVASRPPKPGLEPEELIALRERLISELNGLNTAEDAATWAHRVLSTKDTLTVADAECVEQAFQARLTVIEAKGPTITPPEPPRSRRTDRNRERRPRTSVNKTVLALPVPRRIRDRDHVKSVAKQPCLVCGRHPADAHHLRFAQSPALGRKVSDEFTVPLCRAHHREVHRCGDEAGWWVKIGINAARVLWLKSHPLPSTIEQPAAKSNLEASSP